MSPALEQWKREIEQASGGTLVVVRVEVDPAEKTLGIPTNIPNRQTFIRFISSADIAEQLSRAHALNLNYTGPEGLFHFVVMNLARASDWDGLEDSLLAHEFGHVWLNAQGYRSLSFGDDPLQSCLSTHAGDIVQHILVREETQRRGLDVMAFWLRVHDRWLQQVETQPALPLDRCQKWQQVSEWMDAALGARQWPMLPRYEKLLHARYPELAPTVSTLRNLLDSLPLWDRSLYEHALHRVTEALIGIR